MARAGPKKVERYGDRFKATAVKLSSLPGVRIKDVARTAIGYLMAHPDSSGCPFNRNGSRHAAERAASHLKGKYHCLQTRNLVPDTEAFIERAVSGSSVSGKPCLVKCSDAQAMPSAKWLRQELEGYRKRDAGKDR